MRTVFDRLPSDTINACSFFKTHRFFIQIMAVKIRLQRGGTTHTPHYRIVVAESRFRRDGRFIEVIGRYNPVAKRHSDKCTIELDRADHWIRVGAQPSGTVRGLINRFRRGFYEPSEEELAAKATPSAPAPVESTPAPEQEEVKAEEPAAEAATEEPAAEEPTEEVAEEPAAEEPTEEEAPSEEASAAEEPKEES